MCVLEGRRGRFIIGEKGEDREILRLKERETEKERE